MKVFCPLLPKEFFENDVNVTVNININAQNQIGEVVYDKPIQSKSLSPYNHPVLVNTTGGVNNGVEMWEKLVRKHKNLRFKVYDVMKIDEIEEKFDAIVYLDAACYLPDKELALEKIKKVMNPGARLLVLDWCKKQGLNSAQERLVLHPFMKYWAIPFLETQNNYKKYFKKYGYNIIEMEDMNHKVKKNWEFGYENGIKGIQEVSIKDIPKFIWKGIKEGTESIKLVEEQFPASIYVKAGYDTGFLRYTYMLVENPKPTQT